MDNFWFNFALAWWFLGTLLLLLPVVFSLSLFREGWEDDNAWEMFWGVIGLVLWCSCFIASSVGWMMVIS